MDPLQMTADLSDAPAEQSPKQPLTMSATHHRGTMLLTAAFIAWLAFCDVTIVPLMINIRPPDARAVFISAVMGSFAAQFGVLAV
jgi:hypothetical protein